MLSLPLSQFGSVGCPLAPRPLRWLVPTLHGSATGARPWAVVGVSPLEHFQVTNGCSHARTGAMPLVIHAVQQSVLHSAVVLVKGVVSPSSPMAGHTLPIRHSTNCASMSVRDSREPH